MSKSVGMTLRIGMTPSSENGHSNQSLRMMKMIGERIEHVLAGFFL
jgi:hypothetical protein